MSNVKHHVLKIVPGVTWNNLNDCQYSCESKCFSFLQWCIYLLSNIINMQSVCMCTKDHRFGVRVNKQTWRWDIESFSPGEVSVLYKGEVNTIFNWEAAWKQNLLFSVWYRLGAGMCDLTKKLVGAMGTQYDPEYDVPDTGCSLGYRTWRKYLRYMSTEYDQSMMLPTCCLLSPGHDENIKQLELHASLTF